VGRDCVIALLLPKVPYFYSMIIASSCQLIPAKKKGIEISADAGRRQGQTRLDGNPQPVFEERDLAIPSQIFLCACPTLGQKHQAP